MKTFPLRRAEILENPYSLPKLFERFPFLQEVEHVSIHASLCCTASHSDMHCVRVPPIDLYPALTKGDSNQATNQIKSTL